MNINIFVSCVVYVVLFFFTLPAFALTDSDGDGYYVDDRRPRYVDCNDSDSSIHPFTDDYCDGVDKNCNGVVDEQRSVDATRWYQDSDGDGYGNSTGRRRACTAPTGYVADNTDCNDLDVAINPSVNEAVDGVESDGADNNCDGYTDEIDVPGYTSMTLYESGVSNHGYIYIHNEGTLTFLYSVTLAADSIYLDHDSNLIFTSSPVTLTTGDFYSYFGTLTVSDSTCSGAGSGSNGGGSYDGGGAGGGAHIGLGGDGGNGGWTGTLGSGGSVYGSADDFIAEVGSCGGTGGGPYGGTGGAGGGAITIDATNFYLNIFSAIRADGADGGNGSFDDGGGGGGSGGSIVINAEYIDLCLGPTGSYLLASGGNGGNGGSYSAAGGGGGGGGSGGSIEISYSSSLTCLDGGGGEATYSPEDFSSASASCLEYLTTTSGGAGGSGGCGSSTCGASGSNGVAGAMNSSI